MNQEIIKKLTENIKELLTKLGLSFSSLVVDSVSAKGDEPAFVVRVSSDEDCAMFLGRYGENLKALEHIARAVVAKSTGEKTVFTLDINGYREQRARRVVEIARLVADRVKATQKAEVLFPMPAYERRLVHMELVSMHEILTESIGEEPKRRVVIRPYP